MKAISRRTFIKKSMATSAAAAFAAAPFSRVRGANDEIRAAVIGFHGQGGGLLGALHEASGVRVVALCDVDEKVLYGKADEFKKRGEKVSTHVDYRKMLEDNSIDVVAIATPDHHHVPAAAHAVAAGKDAYVEKPLGHTIRESRLLVELARKHKRIVQHGTQSRSAVGLQKAVEYMRSGALGKIRMAKAINSQRRGKIGRKPDEPTPSYVHYDLWLGPAPERPFNPNRFHYKWHWWWDYGTGDTGNDGIHQIDIARWALGVKMPKSVSCSGGQLWYDDDHQTPDTQIATFEYDDVYIMYEMRLWTPYKHEGHDNGNIFYGDEGKVSIGRSGWQVTFKDGTKGPGGGRDDASHMGNFLKAVRSRKVSDLTADVLEGHYSATLCHMANIATRLGSRLEFDSKREKFIDNKKANRYLSKRYRKGFEPPST